MANQLYNDFKKLGSGDIDWDDNAGTVVKLMLVTNVYVPDIDNHHFISDVTNETSGTGYTAGGNAVVNRTITVDGVNDLAKYDADDVTWASSTITAAFGVLYKDTGTPTTSPLIGVIDFAGDKSSSAGDFIVKWHADGIFTVA